MSRMIQWKNIAKIFKNLIYLCYVSCLDGSRCRHTMQLYAIQSQWTSMRYQCLSNHRTKGFRPQKGQVWGERFRWSYKTLAICKIGLFGPSQLLFAHQQPMLTHILHFMNDTNSVCDAIAQSDCVLDQLIILCVESLSSASFVRK